jgi:hypothetical protein
VAKMKRKQVYIEWWQDRKLKALAERKKMTEAELIRQGLDLLFGAGVGQYQVDRDLAAWKREKAFIRSLIKKGPVSGKRAWSREELYER